MLILTVSDKDINYLHFIAFEILQPIYGDQTKSLREWLSGEGFKRAFLMKNDIGESQAFVNLKIDPSKEYVKISTFFVMPDFRGNGVGKKLLSWVLDYVMSNTSCTYLKVTVSEDKPESLVFFQKNDFQVIDKIEGKYSEGKTEFILTRSLS